MRQLAHDFHHMIRVRDGFQVTDAATQKRFGLALSGGGFRAVLYHLGVIRFLRDAEILSKVTHITSVSGGSVIGAHLVLNWDRYCGSDSEFQEVSAELLRFLQLDVRNRIVRRFPLASMVNAARMAMRLETWRQYTRAGLLEQHYEKHLYGDIGLFNLPDTPHLYILATNLSEGSLCAFHRGGLLLQRRSRSGKEVHFEQLELGMATVPMAVAASSAFPGFFPPIELRGKDVGAKEGEFDRHAFTDGGIYDNVGLRMFRHLQRSASLVSNSAPQVNVSDAARFTQTVMSGSQMSDGTPQRELSKRILQQALQSCGEDATLDGMDDARSPLVGLAEITRTDELYRRPEFQSLPLGDQRAQERLRQVIASGEQPSEYDRIWLNCELASSALQHGVGTACIKPRPKLLDGVFVSDAGASFKIRSDGRAGGLLSTALRSTDILMDRVNQMEMESFADTQGVLFFPISRLVREAEDATAPHVEIQKQAARIRTDMDRFSNLEISSLVRHGYCVARQVFRENSSHSIDELPNGRPWDPLCLSTPTVNDQHQPQNDQRQILSAARELQRSSSRRTFTTLFDFHDWPTYVWVPLIALVLFTLPMMIYNWHQTAVQQSYVLSAIAETSPVYRDVLNLLHSGPRPPMAAISFEETESVEPLNFSGYDVVSDHRIYDLRAWSKKSGDEAGARMHARFRFKRTEEASDRTQLRIHLPSPDPVMRVEYLPSSLRPLHRRKDGTGPLRL